MMGIAKQVAAFNCSSPITTAGVAVGGMIALR
jgi:hypothetical protein